MVGHNFVILLTFLSFHHNKVLLPYALIFPFYRRHKYSIFKEILNIIERDERSQGRGHDDYWNQVRGLEAFLVRFPALAKHRSLPSGQRRWCGSRGGDGCRGRSDGGRDGLKPSKASKSTTCVNIPFFSGCALKLGAPDLLFVDIISVVAGRPLFGLLLLLLLLPPLFFFLVRLYKTDDVCKPLQTGRLGVTVQDTDTSS